MSTTQNYMRQLESMGQMPNFQQEVAKAYETPVLRPLVQEGANLESQYLPSLFNPFTQMGTEASDMSPAAKLASLGSSMGRLSSRIGANNAMQNYFGAQIGDIANNMSNQWQQRYNSIKDLYNMAFQNEEAQRQQAARNAQLAAQRRAEQSQLDLLRQLQAPQGNKLPTLTPAQQNAVGYVQNYGNALATQLQPLTNVVSRIAPVVQTLLPNILPRIFKR